MKNIHILYGTQTGNAQEISRNIYQLLIEKKYDCKILSLNKTIENNSFNFINDDNNVLIIVCSTTGNGDAPETANLFWRKLKNRNQPKNLLDKIEYTILGLGNSNYDKFCQMGKNLDKRFFELGAKRFLELQCFDEAVDEDESIELFIDKVIKYIVD
jgi:sulfite reductase alpha subunit-like flavoprotein